MSAVPVAAQGQATWLWAERRSRPPAMHPSAAEHGRALAERSRWRLRGALRCAEHGLNAALRRRMRASPLVGLPRHERPRWGAMEDCKPHLGQGPASNRGTEVGCNLQDCMITVSIALALWVSPPNWYSSSRARRGALRTLRPTDATRIHKSSVTKTKSMMAVWMPYVFK